MEKDPVFVFGDVFGDDTGWIDNQRACQLCLEGMPLGNRATCGGTPVKVRARCAGLEPKLLRGARWHGEGVFVLARPFVQAVQRDFHRKRIMHLALNFRPLWHADERTRVLQWPPHLTEGVDGNGLSVLAPRMPLTFANLKMEG